MVSIDLLGGLCGVSPRTLRFKPFFGRANRYLFRVSLGARLQPSLQIGGTSYSSFLSPRRLMLFVASFPAVMSASNCSRRFAAVLRI